MVCFPWRQAGCWESGFLVAASEDAAEGRLLPALPRFTAGGRSGRRGMTAGKLRSSAAIQNHRRKACSED